MHERLFARFLVPSLLCVGMFITRFGLAAEPAGNIDSPAYWQPAQAALAQGGDGFIVWESFRSGSWRIWTIRLDGAGLRQVSPEEAGRDHYCPHISPDGQKIVYLSYPQPTVYDQESTGGYAAVPVDQKVPLHLMDADGSNDRVIAPNACSYYEDRAVVWFDNEELCYIDPTGNAHVGLTYQLNINTGAREKLSDDQNRLGYLINATKTYATSGEADFAPYDPKTKRIPHRNLRGGCQPYLTQDGVWGYWMQAPGGPISRIHLATGQIKPIMLGSYLGPDPRMPKERIYLYFPHYSSNSRLLAFGASPNQFDHFKSDYEIFVVPADPKTLELIGSPVRYTFDPKCDRFPDVWQEEPALGCHENKAPFTVALNAPGGEWKWDFGDGALGNGAAVKHTYAKPGLYAVTARQGDRALRGQVLVREAKAPALTSVAVNAGQEITLVFSEPVQLNAPAFNLKSGTGVSRWELSPDGFSLRLLLARKLASRDTLEIKGVCDRAQTPNGLAAGSVAIDPLSWPPSREGLVFIWQNSENPNLVPDAATRGEISFSLEYDGQVRFDRYHAIILGKGRAWVPENMCRLLSSPCDGPGLTVEATLRPANLTQEGPATIFSDHETFTLGQQKDHLVLELRTVNERNEKFDTVPLGTLSATEPNHVLVSYSTGQLTCYINGVQTKATGDIKGNFAVWTRRLLRLGAANDGSKVWAGTLEGVALYNRGLSVEEAKAHCESYKTILSARKPLARLELQAKLKAKSKIPTLQEIQPYRQALVLYEYDVTKVISGQYAGKHIRVGHWVILNGNTLPISQAKEGTEVKLVLEPYTENPQLESLYCSDSLEPNADPFFFDVAAP